MILAVAALAAASLSAADPPPSRLVFKTRGNPYPTGATAADLAAGDSVRFTVREYGPSNARAGATITVDFGEHKYWSILIATADRSALRVAGYVPAARMGGSRPGERLATLDFSGCGRGSNTSLGSFEVREVRWGPGNAVAALAVDFTVYEEGQDHSVVWGALRYRSDVPVPDLKDPAPIPK